MFVFICSQISLLSDRVEAVNQHVNAFDIDTVVKHLRYVCVCVCVGGCFISYKSVHACVFVCLCLATKVLSVNCRMWVDHHRVGGQ